MHPLPYLSRAFPSQRVKTLHIVTNPKQKILIFLRFFSCSNLTELKIKNQTMGAQCPVRSLSIRHSSSQRGDPSSVVRIHYTVVITVNLLYPFGVDCIWVVFPEVYRIHSMLPYLSISNCRFFTIQFWWGYRIHERSIPLSYRIFSTKHSLLRRLAWSALTCIFSQFRSIAISEIIPYHTAVCQSLTEENNKQTQHPRRILCG